MKINWKKSKGADGYQVKYKAKGGKWINESVSSPKKSIKLKGLKSKKSYQVKIRSFKKVSGQNFYSKWSKAKTVKVK